MKPPKKLHEILEKYPEKFETRLLRPGLLLVQPKGKTRHPPNKWSTKWYLSKSSKWAPIVNKALTRMAEQRGYKLKVDEDGEQYYEVYHAKRM